MAMNLYLDEQLIGSLPFAPAISVAMNEFGVPRVVTSSDCGMHFISRLIKPVYDTLRLLTMNLSRQRQRLETLIKDWAGIQVKCQPEINCWVREP